MTEAPGVFETDTQHDVHAIHSQLREAIVEHLFVGELLRRLWQREIYSAEILRSEFDAGGYDLVLSYGAITRHIQMKIVRDGGARRDVSIGLRLAAKPSGCVVWAVVDADLNLLRFLWFGGTPGEPLPGIDHLRVGRHTKGNAEGDKKERPAQRLVPRSAFAPIASMDDLIHRLLGDLAAA